MATPFAMSGIIDICAKMYNNLHMMTPTLHSVDSLLTEIGTRLRAERQRRSLTQDDLARQAGVSRQTVITAESGHGISLRGLLSMLEVLGVRMTFSLEVAQPRRPLIKDLMREARARQATRVSHHESGQSTLPVRTSQAAVAHTPERPRIKGLMAAHRARRDGNTE